MIIQNNHARHTRNNTPTTHLLQSAVHVADAAHVLEADEASLALVLGNLVRLLTERRRS